MVSKKIDFGEYVVHIDYEEKGNILAIMVFDAIGDEIDGLLISDISDEELNN